MNDVKETVVRLMGGKYELRHENGRNFRALRYGEPWRDLTGDGMVLALVQRIEELEEAATLKAAQGGVTEAMVQDALDSWYDLSGGIHGDDLRDRMRAALEAALSAQQGQGEAVIDAKYDNVLVPFARLMAKELHANAGKGDRPGWLSMTPAIAMLEIYYHAAKLQKAVKDDNGEGIREYAADVANMAMMLLDLCGGLAVTDTTPPAQPAERVPELARTLVDTIDNECEMVLSSKVWAVKEALQQSLAATPAPSEGGKGVEG